jgi:peptidoglycan biosynthesis protein MviN/MurJ (putative lipid II flippase)
MSSASPGFSGVRVSQSVVFCARFCVLFAIVMPALLLFTASDYPFGICKHSKRFVRFSLLQFLLSLFLCCCCCCWYLSSFCLSDIYYLSVFLIFIIFLSFWYLSYFCLSDKQQQQQRNKDNKNWSKENLTNLLECLQIPKG